MKKLAILAADDYLRSADLWRPFADRYEIVDYSDFAQWDEDALAEKLRQVDAAVTGRKSPKVPNSLASNRGKFKWVCHLHGTIRHLVEKPLIEAGLTVSNWGDAVTGVAEGAFTLLLACLKQLPLLDAHCRTGQDGRIPRVYSDTLRKLPVGLYGYGAIGRHMGRMLLAFEADVAIYDPLATDIPAGIRRVGSLRELFASSMAVSIHCGLNDATRQSVTRELLELLPQGGVLVNTARGGIVRETDLADVLQTGRIWAGIDVIKDEGFRDAWQRSPLAKCPYVILTHHRVCGSALYPAGFVPKRQLPDFAVANFDAFAAGRPLINVVSAAVYDVKT